MGWNILRLWETDILRDPAGAGALIRQELATKDRANPTCETTIGLSRMTKTRKLIR